MTFLEPLRYLIRELHRAAEQLYSVSSEPEELRKAVLLFIANGLQAATELSRLSDERLAGWMVARTLWHNAACLALILLDKPGHRRIAELLDLDNDLRAANILVDQTTQILGGKEAKRVFGEVAFDREQVSEDAKSARHNKPNTGGWESIRAKDLRGALQRLCDKWAVDAPDTAVELRAFVANSDVARTRGDAVAHPNLFGIQTILQVVDLEGGRIKLDPPDEANDAQLRQMVTVNLLLLHAAVLALRFPSVVDLPQMLQGAQELMPAEGE